MALLTLDYTVVNLTICEECSAEGAWVKVKKHLTRRDRNAIRGAVMAMRVEIDGETGAASMPSGVDIDGGKMLDALDFSVLERAIVGWSFEDECTLENMERMHDDDINQLKEVLSTMYEVKDASTKNTNG